MVGKSVSHYHVVEKLAAGAQIADALDIAHAKGIIHRDASTLALCGDANRAQKLIDELAKESPLDTLLNNLSIPVARAIIEIQRITTQREPLRCWRRPARTTSLITRPCTFAGRPSGACMREKRPLPSTKRSWTIAA